MTMVRRHKNFLRSANGATAVEFALVIGPLILLLVGVTEVGRMLWSGHAIDEVAISGARCIGILAPGCATGDALEPERAVAYIQQAARSWGVVLEPGDISLATNSGCAIDTGFPRVAVTLRFASVIPGLSGTRLDAEACFPSQL